ncbi:hypothetical protein H4R34_001963 [Dimargaris verticillata]|uniref:Cytochrome P450 n=1 Tax=Dimargaris verticillata TaxID=2761393 RepID=A0A9W8B3N2_9FUNG|nr:hypothetical protein H4R34_001963 [Dimargaris verticillata]
MQGAILPLGAEVVLGLLAGLVYVIYRQIRVPAHLQGLPRVPLTNFFKWGYNKTSPLEQFFEMRDFFLQHETYVTWVGGDWKLVTTNLEHVKDIFTKTNHTIEKSIPNRDYPESLFRRFIGTSVIFSNHEVWARIRRIISPAFSNTQPTRVIGEVTKTLIAKLDKEDTSRLVMDKPLSHMAMDVLGQTIYGFNFNALENPDTKYAVLLQSIVSKLSNPVYLLFPYLDNLPFFRRDDVIRDLDELDEYMYKMIDEKRRQLAANPVRDRANVDLLTLMLEACEDSETTRLSNQELRDNTTALFLAGHENTALSIGFWMYMMSKNLDLQEKCRDEVLSVMGDAPEDLIPTDEQLKQMSYLHASILENLRFNPPIPLIVARETSVDQTIAGIPVPAGTSVGTNVIAVQHNPNYYPDPETFNPDRFLQKSTGERFLPKFIPFGSGPRQCIAKNFALLNEQVVIAMLLRKYTWTLVLGEDGKETIWSTPFSMFRINNLILNLKARY